MEKPLSEFLNQLGIDCTNRKPNHIGLYAGPYSIWQDGTKVIAPYRQFGNEIIETIKFMAPKSPFYIAYSRPECFAVGDVELAVQTAKHFAMVWTAMFDQLKGTCADIKDNGGMFVFPERRYWQQKLDLFPQLDKPTKTQMREELVFVLTECVVHNYREAERVNQYAPADKQATLTDRTREFVINLAKDY